MVEDTHEIKVAGEEKIAGRNTYHIIATTKEENNLIGNLEMWVDKENWMVLKSITNGASLEMVTEYKVFDLSPKIEKDLFVLEIPEGVVVEKPDMDIVFEQVEMATVKEKLGAFLIFGEHDLIVESIQDYGSESRLEYAFSYSKDSEKWLTLSVFPSSQVVEDDVSLGEEKITVRGIEGEQLDLGEFRFIQWSENNLTYNVSIEHSDIEFDEVYAYIEKMGLFNKRAS